MIIPQVVFYSRVPSFRCFCLEPGKEEIQLTEEERAAALGLLRDPNLLGHILADFERCGVVGEETNKKVSYLATVSRLLPAPC